LVNWVLTPAAQSLIVAGNMNGLPVIPTSKLEASVAANVSSIDITTLRPGYFSSNASDLRAAWAAEVPGK